MCTQTTVEGHSCVIIAASGSTLAHGRPQPLAVKLALLLCCAGRHLAAHLVRTGRGGREGEGEGGREGGREGREGEEGSLQ